MVIVHNSSQDRNKKQAGSATVYRFEAIPPRTAFCGVILAQDAEDLKQVSQWLDGATVTLGGSQNAGYGRVQLKAQMVENWQEYTQSGDAGSEDLVITLLSDAILRTADGQGSADFDRALSEALGLAQVIKPS